MNDFLVPILRLDIVHNHLGEASQEPQEKSVSAGERVSGEGV